MSVCLDCGQTCESNVSFKYHMQRVHDKHACMRCAKAFSSRAAFERHAVTHTSSEPHLSKN